MSVASLWRTFDIRESFEPTWYKAQLNFKQQLLKTTLAKEFQLTTKSFANAIFLVILITVGAILSIPLRGHVSYS